MGNFILVSARDMNLDELIESNTAESTSGGNAESP